MLKIYNSLNIEVTCLGNHDTDFGIEVMQKNLAGCNSPWIISNFKMPGTNEVFGGLKQTHITEHQGVKVGIIGLCEPEWI